MLSKLYVDLLNLRRREGLELEKNENWRKEQSHTFLQAGRLMQRWCHRQCL
jgi:hypothetical protein